MKISPNYEQLEYTMSGKTYWRLLKEELINQSENFHF